nr:MAG TPA: HNH endonuclease bacteriophage, HNH Endonuclease, DNA.52A [Caudoviricetes sp.]
MARNNTYYKEWVRKVFDRDNYTCQCCGKRGSNLNAHHLYNFQIIQT